MRIKHKNFKYPIYLRKGSYDTNIFYQIFIEGELNYSYKNNASVILDLGGNIGLASVYFINKFPEAKIISVEPDENNFCLMTKNLKPYKNIIPLRGGIYSKDCELYLVDIGEGEASYQIREQSDGKSIISSVKCFSISTVKNMFNLNHIDIVKMDIEGAEKDCLLENTDWINSVSLLAVEIHEFLVPGLYNAILLKHKSNFNVLSMGEYTFFEKTKQL